MSFGSSIAGLFRFCLSFVLIPSSGLRERLIRILEGLGGQAGCHMYWALGSRRSLFGWFVLCSVVASRRCYLGMSDSHLLLSWAGSGCCDTTPDIGQTQLCLSLLRRESRAAVLPPPLVLLDKLEFAWEKLKW